MSEWEDCWLYGWNSFWGYQQTIKWVNRACLQLPLMLMVCLKQLKNRMNHYTYLKQSSSILTFETIYFWLEFLGIFFFLLYTNCFVIIHPLLSHAIDGKKISQISNSTFHKIKVQTNKQTTNFFFLLFFLFIFFWRLR